MVTPKRTKTNGGVVHTRGMRWTGSPGRIALRTKDISRGIVVPEFFQAEFADFIWTLAIDAAFGVARGYELARMLAGAGCGEGWFLHAALPCGIRERLFEFGRRLGLNPSDLARVALARLLVHSSDWPLRAQKLARTRGRGDSHTERFGFAVFNCFVSSDFGRALEAFACFQRTAVCAEKPLFVGQGHKTVPGMTAVLSRALTDDFPRLEYAARGQHAGDRISPDNVLCVWDSKPRGARGRYL
jgi:hypothetical protein